MRLIDADALDFSSLKHEEYPHYIADEIVERAPTIEAEPVKHGRWISVEDRLPDIISVEKAGRNTYKKSCRVLCACLQASGKQMVKEGYYYFFNDYPSPCWKIPGTIHSVTHWMPLPKPPNCGAKMDLEG